MAAEHPAAPDDRWRRTTYRRYGVGVELAGPTELVAAAAERLLPVPRALEGRLAVDASPPHRPRRYHIAEHSDGAGPPWELTVDDGPPRRGLGREEVLRAIESDAKLWITSTTARVVFVHAGVVSWQGRALVLPGRSFAGKSTLVRSLIREGAVYFSDDYAVLDTEGLVWPCPLKLARRGPDGERALLDAEELGARVGEEGVPLGWVLETRFEEGAVLEPRRMTPAETALRLLDNAPAARIRPGDVLQALALACTGAVGLSGPRGEARTEAPRILGTLLADNSPVDLQAEPGETGKPGSPEGPIRTEAT